MKRIYGKENQNLAKILDDFEIVPNFTFRRWNGILRNIKFMLRVLLQQCERNRDFQNTIEIFFTKIFVK
jgi:hypothetical protein